MARRELKEREDLYNVGDLMGYLTVKENKYYWLKKSGKKAWEEDYRVDCCYDEFRQINYCAKYLLDNPSTIDRVLKNSERPEILYYFKKLINFTAILKSKTYIMNCLAANIKATHSDLDLKTEKEILGFYSNIDGETQLVEPNAVYKILKFFVLSNILLNYGDQELELMSPDENRINANIADSDDGILFYYRQRWSPFTAFLICYQLDRYKWEHISEAEYNFVKNSIFYKALNSSDFISDEEYVRNLFIIYGRQLGRMPSERVAIYFPKVFVDEVKKLSEISANYDIMSSRMYRSEPEYFAPRQTYSGWDNSEFSMDIHGEND